MGGLFLFLGTGGGRNRTFLRFSASAFRSRTGLGLDRFRRPRSLLRPRFFPWVPRSITRLLGAGLFRLSSNITTVFCLVQFGGSFFFRKVVSGKAGFNLAYHLRIRIANFAIVTIAKNVIGLFSYSATACGRKIVEKNSEKSFFAPRFRPDCKVCNRNGFTIARRAIA